MAIILSSLLYARAPQPLRPTPHTPFFSLLWAVWTLIDELRGQWMEDGARMRMRGSSRYVQIVSFSSLSSISCISAAPFRLVVVAHILEAGEDMLKFCYHVKLLSCCLSYAPHFVPIRLFGSVPVHTLSAHVYTNSLL